MKKYHLYLDTVYDIRYEILKCSLLNIYIYYILLKNLLKVKRIVLWIIKV